MRLPLELFDAIIDFALHDDDLKALRLVNEAFSITGATRLFHSMQLSTFMRDPNGTE